MPSTALASVSAIPPTRLPNSFARSAVSSPVLISAAMKQAQAASVSIFAALAVSPASPGGEGGFLESPGGRVVMPGSSGRKMPRAPAELPLTSNCVREGLVCSAPGDRGGGAVDGSSKEGMAELEDALGNGHERGLLGRRERAWVDVERDQCGHDRVQLPR